MSRRVSPMKTKLDDLIKEIHDKQNDAIVEAQRWSNKSKLIGIPLGTRIEYTKHACYQDGKAEGYADALTEISRRWN